MYSTLYANTDDDVPTFEVDRMVWSMKKSNILRTEYDFFHEVKNS